jgi:hypothetical protein
VSELDERSNSISRLDLAVANVGSGDRAGSSSRSNVLALEVTEEARVGRGEGTRAAEGVVLAAAADVRAADTTTAGNSEILASSAGLDHGSHVLNLVSLSKDVATLSELESVTLGVDIVPNHLLDNELGIAKSRRKLPVVVDSVKNGIALDLRGTARGVVNVVALESDHVVGASEVKSPVVTSITGGRPGA